jgi:biotin synthase-like enzyme
MNRWNIPAWLEAEIVKRDQACVYCGIAFLAEPSARSRRPSWEHIVNDARVVTRENIARCCISCNASKGAKELLAWLSSKYCVSRGISKNTVARVVREALARTGEAGQSEA